jgi:hypothetical protein
MLIFLSKIRRKFERCLVFTGIETRKLKKILRVHAIDWTLFRPLLLWVCIMAALEVNDRDRAWFRKLIAQNASLMGLVSWDEVVEICSNLLWIRGVA